MQRSTQFFGIMLFAVVTGLSTTSCTNETAAPDNAQQNLTTQDGWRISWFWDKDKDETSDFSGYVFHFRDGGQFDATRSGVTQSGTWRVTQDDGSQRLIIQIAQPKPLDELNDDWIILEQTSSLVSLRDDNDEHLEEVKFIPVQ